ncbi:MAG: aldehyde dehydrogenase, partial [Pedobacter sp.]|nr:aldehyde dehydrogenase [Pedobacter sp.]
MLMQTNIHAVLQNLGISEVNPAFSTGSNWGDTSAGKAIESYSPVDGKLIASIKVATAEEYEKVLVEAVSASNFWKNVPAPKRGDLVRQLGDALRLNKNDLGTLVSYEMGKSLQEGLGEVQEMIDICDFAVGQSRQLYGLTMHSERPSHRMYEQWHPLGIVGIISAFNFPVAVWSWNTALALVCGNVCIWKPSSKTPLCAIACQRILAKVLQENNMPEGISNLLIGNAVGDLMNNDKRIGLVSFTGSTRIGRIVAAAVANRFGRSILELGGNNSIIISKDADLDMSIIGAVFGAVGTAGQRCTSTRRLIVQEDIYEDFKAKLVKAYGQLRIGDPLNENNHVGPLIDTAAVEMYTTAIARGEHEGANFVVKGGVLCGEAFGSGCYVQPCVAEVENHYDIVQEETFAPILYLIKYKTLDEAIALQNGVPQGLSSAIMTLNLREAEQ